MMPRSAVFFLFLLLIPLPLALASAQDPEAEVLRRIEQALVHHYALETVRLEGAVTFQIRMALSSSRPDEGDEDFDFAFLIPAHYQYQIATRLQDGQNSESVGTLRVAVEDMVELSDDQEFQEFQEFMEEAQFEFASYIELEFAIVGEERCFYQSAIEGDLFATAMSDFDSLHRDTRDIIEELNLLHQLFLEDGSDWLGGLRELGSDEHTQPGTQAFQLNIDPERGNLANMLFAQLEDTNLAQMGESLLDKFFTSFFANASEETTLWIGDQDGNIHRIDMSMAGVGSFDALDEPQMGQWVEMGLSIESSTQYRDHNQLSEDDFTLPCLPR